MKSPRSPQQAPAAPARRFWMVQLARNDRICIADNRLAELPPGQVRVLRIVGSIYLEAAKDRSSSIEFDFMPR
jgi:hypothetical protein